MRRTSSKREEPRRWTLTFEVQHACKMSSKLFMVLRSVCVNRYAFGFKRTMDHLHSWPIVLPESVKRAEVSLSKRNETDPLSPHHGTRYRRSTEVTCYSYSVDIHSCIYYFKFVFSTN